MFDHQHIISIDNRLKMFDKYKLLKTLKKCTFKSIHTNSTQFPIFQIELYKFSCFVISNQYLSLFILLSKYNSWYYDL